MRRTVEFDVVLQAAPSLGVLPARRKRARLMRALRDYLLLWPAAFALVAILMILIGSHF